MDYLELLEKSYKAGLSCEDHSSVDGFLANLFGLTLYDESADELFVRKYVEVVDAITENTTFEYIKDQDNYMWYLIVVNSMFLKGRTDWGASIRGAWWDSKQPPLVCFLRDSNWHVIEELEFVGNTWKKFVKAVVEFYRKYKEEL